MDTTASSKPEFSKLDQEINTDRLIHMPDNASLSKQKRVAQHRVLSLAPRRRRRVAVVGPSRECACLTDDTDPSSCSSRAQPRPQSGTASQCSTVWVCSRVESRLARCILVWDVISLSCASLALSYESKSPGLVGPDPGTGPGQHGPQPGASESSELHCPGWTCPQASSPGHAPAHPSRRNWWREWRRGTSPTCVPAATMATCAMPRLSGPGRAGWPAGASPRADGSAVPAFLVGTPGPAPGSVLALTGSDSSESGHSCPRPASVSRSGWRGQLAPARYPRPVPGAIARKGSGRRWPLPRVLSAQRRSDGSS